MVRGELSWIFYALPLHFELHTYRKDNANANTWLTQMQTHTRRHYTTTVQNRFTNTTLPQCKHKCKRIKGALALGCAESDPNHGAWSPGVQEEQ